MKSHVTHPKTSATAPPMATEVESGDFVMLRAMHRVKVQPSMSTLRAADTAAAWMQTQPPAALESADEDTAQPRMKVDATREMGLTSVRDKQPPRASPTRELTGKRVRGCCDAGV